MKYFNIKNISSLIVLACLSMACQDDLSEDSSSSTDLNLAGLSEEYYSGGVLGTTFNETTFCFEQATPAVSMMGLASDFLHGEALFEDPFRSEKNYLLDENYVNAGLGPLYIRSACIDCHPGYGHGKRLGNIDNTPVYFNTSDKGNGYLLVVYTAGTDGTFGADEPITNSSTIFGSTYTDYGDDDKYSTQLTGMPQTKSISPFPAPLDESKIKIEWKEWVDEWDNKYADGTSYQLIYPEVSFEAGAVYYEDAFTELQSGNYKVKLEATIGIYGTGLIDAITEEDIDEEYSYQQAYSWGGRRGAEITQLDGETRKGRYTYGLSRGTLQHGPGSNALWNITNVTRETGNPLYRTNYCTSAYAEAVINDTEVMTALKEDNYYNFLIADQDPTSEASKNAVYNYLLYNNAYTGAKLTGQNTNVSDASGTHYADKLAESTQVKADISQDDYTKFMVWHRGLAVPAARNLDDQTVQLGKQLFYSDDLGCTACHRPSWTTGYDNYVGDADMDGKLPTYPGQKIWPYSDFLQHNLGMKNNIRTGWCRTTPLWGRSLNLVANGESSHLHDMRARTYEEAIMWHKGQGKYSSDAFRKLSKTNRDAMVRFLESI